MSLSAQTASTPMLQATRAFAASVASAYPMQQTTLFGSRARGTEHVESDADVAVILQGAAGHDILSVRVSDKPIVREVSQSWHINTCYAADGTVVEVVLLDAHKDGQLSIERAAVIRQILKSLNVPDADIEAVWKPKACPPLPKTSKTSKTKQRRLIPTPKALEKALKLSADRVQRLATAFGLKVSGIKPKAAKS